MLRSYLIAVLSVIVILTGCKNNLNSINDTATTDTDCNVHFETPYIETVSSTISTISETIKDEPPKKLNSPSGIHYGIYGDTESEDYMDYYLFVPENATENMPLIVFLHGDGEVGMSYMMETEGMIVSAHKVYGDQFPFLLLQPCTRQKSWSDFGIPERLMGLIENLKNTYSVDPNKIIITGHSRGAIGVWNMVNTYGSYFSAAVPVSGAAYIPLNYENCTQLPIRCFTGDTWVEMQYYDVEILEVEAVNEAGGDAEIIILEGTDHGRSYESAYTEETFEWMLTR